MDMLELRCETFAVDIDANATTYAPATALLVVGQYGVIERNSGRWVARRING